MCDFVKRYIAIVIFEKGTEDDLIDLQYEIFLAGENWDEIADLAYENFGA